MAHKNKKASNKQPQQQKKQKDTQSRESKLSLKLQDHLQIIQAVAQVPLLDATATAAPVNSSYYTAASECRARVKAIAAACRKQNIRFRDRYFDLKFDNQDCLKKLSVPAEDQDDDGDDFYYQQGTVERIQKLFEKPAFFKNGGMLPGDIEQGAEGDCWFLAALSILASDPALLKRTMVERDEKVGVYGFVFYRDGQWISSIVDDQLATNHDDFRLQSELKKEEYEKTFLRGSKALKFAKSKDANETWVPLIEKAYAKAHGDYEAIEGGEGVEAVEDLTGGVCTIYQTDDILDTDKFWNEELLQMHKGKVFFVSMTYDTQGLFGGHEYCILRAIEVKGKRFLLIRNPWGKSEWTGKWSDGSAEWDGEWMTLLNHRFGDDGQFWMEYSDALGLWDCINRTMLFDDSWFYVKSPVEIKPEFPAVYSPTVFDIKTSQDGPVVAVFSQIDSRYFCGLEGEYEFLLTFRIVQLISDSATNTIQEVEFEQSASESYQFLRRSTFVEIPHLPAGNYRLYPKVSATPLGQVATTDDVIEFNGKQGRQFKIEKQLKSLAMAKQVSLLRTQKLRKETVEAKKAAIKKVKEEKEAEKKKVKEDKEAEEKKATEKKEDEEKTKEVVPVVGETKKEAEGEEVPTKNEVVVLQTADSVESNVEASTLVVEVVNVAQDANVDAFVEEAVVEEPIEGNKNQVEDEEVDDEEVEEEEEEEEEDEGKAIPSVEKSGDATETQQDDADEGEESDAEDAEEEVAPTDFELSASTFLRVYSKDSTITVTTRFLDLEVDKFLLPECLRKPESADPTADFYFSSDVFPDFSFDSSSQTQSFLKQKTAIAERSGTSARM
ncbi:UNVERIFIED_CONTAM: hypothetical protein HDU68_002451 [Siphonaria sp. JEL0065]|nr:hypothetical protein HDU68_002451 [Siphonaria sp. JEL0065]